MSRQIKFRGWFDTISAFEGNSRGHYKYFNQIEAAGYWADPGGCILQQFTGLQDKNGRDIYEGDIIKDNISLPDSSDNYSVIKFSQYEDDEQYSTFQHLGWHADGISLADLYSKCEIVGNIHEHPELLEGK